MSDEKRINQHIVVFYFLFLAPLEKIRTKSVYEEAIHTSLLISLSCLYPLPHAKSHHPSWNLTSTGSRVKCLLYWQLGQISFHFLMQPTWKRCPQGKVLKKIG